MNIVKYFSVNVVSLSIIHGSKSTIVKTVKNIFGTNVNVISCIDVAAWKIETIIPTTIATANIGSKIINAFINAPLKTE